jgi:hypothetical protein
MTRVMADRRDEATDDFCILEGFIVDRPRSRKSMSIGTICLLIVATIAPDQPGFCRIGRQMNYVTSVPNGQRVTVEGYQLG